MHLLVQFDQIAFITAEGCNRAFIPSSTKASATI